LRELFETYKYIVRKKCRFDLGVRGTYNYHYALTCYLKFKLASFSFLRR